ESCALWKSEQKVCNEGLNSRGMRRIVSPSGTHVSPGFEKFFPQRTVELSIPFVIQPNRSVGLLCTRARAGCVAGTCIGFRRNRRRHLRRLRGTGLLAGPVDYKRRYLEGHFFPFSGAAHTLGFAHS